jgi:malonyl-CoA/methylmalonyl-CoA synthetase
VLSSHRALTAQISTLVSAWEWRSDDHILHFLPLHHVHGVVNKLCCALWIGATVEFVRFAAADVWKRFARGEAGTVFMAVPTIYSKLIEHYDTMEDADRRLAAAGAAKLRLMVRVL